MGHGIPLKIPLAMPLSGSGRVADLDCPERPPARLLPAGGWCGHWQPGGVGGFSYPALFKRSRSSMYAYTVPRQRQDSVLLGVPTYSRCEGP